MEAHDDVVAACDAAEADKVNRVAVDSAVGVVEVVADDVTGSCDHVLVVAAVEGQ